MWKPVTPVLLTCPPVELCSRRYPGHSRGCPNWGKRPTCPPQAEIWTPDFLAGHMWYAIWNRFAFGDHVERMRALHPDWSERQLACCLYWQPGARKRLQELIVEFDETVNRDDESDKIVVFTIPEAHGCNVTETMRQIGIELEWPPRKWTYQVALAYLQQEG